MNFSRGLQFCALVGVSLILSVSGGHAANTLYVSASGTATTVCSYSAPCATIQNAVDASAIGDTIVCLSAPRRAGISVDKSLTIDCSAGPATVDYRALTAFPSGSASLAIFLTSSNADPSPTIRLRGFVIDGGRNGTSSVDLGINIHGAIKAVHIENSVISNFVKFGIYDDRYPGQTRLYISNTTVSGNGGPGIIVAAQGGSSTVLDNVSLLNNTYGIAAAVGNNVVIRNTTISGNTTAGVHADGGAQINVSDSTLSHNTTNVNAIGIIRLKENAIQFSNSAVQGSGSRSAGANRFLGNVSIGSTPPLTTGAPADVFD